MSELDGEQGAWPRVLRWSALLMPLHGALPLALRYIDQQQGRSSAQAWVVAVHLLFPFAYILISDRIPLTFAHWAALLALNHLAILVGALALLWI